MIRVRVELCAEPMGGGDPVREPMSREPKGLGRASLYVCAVPASRPAWHYTPRVVPHHTRARVPLEGLLIFWYKRT